MTPYPITKVPGSMPIMINSVDLSMNKTTKKIWLHYVLAPLAFAVLLLLIYKQVVARGDFAEQWAALKEKASHGALPYLFLVLILALVNWSLEAFKWQTLVEKIQPISYAKAFASMLTGMAFSLVTPNRTGDFAGRILHVAHKNRFKAAIASVIGSMAQMMVTSLFGFIGLVYYNLAFPPTFFTGLALLLAVLVLGGLAGLYFNLDKLFVRQPKNKWLRRFRLSLRVLKRYGTGDLLKIFLLALGRFVIFNAQFLLLANVFGATVPAFPGFFLSSLMFWIIAVVPSVAMLELGVRGYAGIFLFVENGMTTTPLPIITASYLLWLINLVLPAALGSFMVFGLRRRQ